MHSLRFLHPPPLHLSSTLCLRLAPTPLSIGGTGVSVVGLSLSPHPFGGCSGNLLWTHFARPGKRRHRVPITAAASPAWRPDQGLLPQSRDDVEGLRSISGGPNPLPLLLAACWGVVRLQASPGPSSIPAQVSQWTVTVHLPPVHNSAGSLDVPVAVFARSLPKVPLPAAGGSCGLPGLEGTLSGLV